MHYAKQPLGIEQQLQSWEAGGVACADRQKALRYLSNISAYRLKPYKQLLLDKHSAGKPIEFDKIIRLYVFDKRIRLLLFDAIERIEVAVRAQFVNCYGVRYGDHWHLEANHFRNPVAFASFQNELKNISDPKHRYKQPTFIRHYFEKYTDGPLLPPCSMLMETLSFGQISRLFKDLANNEGKRDIALHFGVKDALLESWLHSLSYLRNACAHHAHVWNRQASIASPRPKSTADKWLDISQISEKKLYMMLAVVCYLLRRISPHSTFQQRLMQTIAAEGDDMLYAEMGFPHGWQHDSFWQDEPSS